MRSAMTTEEVMALQYAFRNEFVPLCIENKFSLNQAFEYTREHDPQKYKVLSKL